MGTAMHRSTGDFWRGLSMVGVVCIHAAGRFEGSLHGGSWLTGAGLAGLLSQWARFCVPMFIVMSGYGLACSERGGKTPPSAWRAWLEFWRRRASRVLVPYLVWSLLAQARSLSFDAQGLETFALQLMEGSADYHLYFCSIILQAYLLWPLLKRAPWWCVAGLLALQLLLASPSHLIWPGRPHVPGWCLPHWAGYFALGAKLAGAAPPRARPRGAVLLWCLAGLGVVLEYAWWAARLDHPDWYNHFFRYTVLAYALATVWLWRSSDAALAGLLERRGWQRLVARLAGASFCVYLIHPWLLRALHRTPLAPYFLLLFPVLLVASFGAALLAEALLVGGWTRIPRLCLGLGPPQSEAGRKP